MVDGARPPGVRPRRSGAPVLRRAAASAALLLVGATCAATVPTARAADVAPVNPVTVPVDGHAANQGFLVFVEGDVRLAADEAEGTLAAGGDLRFDTSYNIGAGSGPLGAPTLPGDTSPTYLYVGGGVTFPEAGSGAVLRVLDGGLAHVGDTTTYDAFDTDQNGAAIPYRIVPEGATAETIPRIEGTVQQSPEDIARTADPAVLDFGASFARYRFLSSDIGTCPATTTLRDEQGNTIASPVAPGSTARVAVEQGRTNVLTVSAADLDALSLLTFDGLPGPGAPLVVNVTGSAFDGSVPNLANLTNANAPFVLWNFPDATSVHVIGADVLEGTIYAPRADVRWDVTQNIEGNVIAASFTHGVPAGPRPVPLEIHGFPFAATVSCVSVDDAAGSLTLVKQVVGGTADATDWTLTADGPATISGPSGSADVTARTVPAGDYTLSETGGPDGYVPGAWVCTGATARGDEVTVGDGDDVVCTITNTAASTPTPTPTPEPSPDPTTGPGPSPDPDPTAAPTVDPTATPTPGPVPPAGDGGNGPGPAGPQPGADGPSVGAGPGTGPDGVLAWTGAHLLPLGLTAAVLLAAGLALTLARVARRGR